MTGDRKIARYVETRRELATLRRQLAEYPELSASRRFLDDLYAATVAANQALGPLTGGQIARARRLLADLGAFEGRA